MAGLSSLSKNINIKGQPHSLAYINKAEAALLKARGGSGKPMKGTRGVPAYIDMGDNDGARTLLNEVTSEGDEAQIKEANDLLGSLE